MKDILSVKNLSVHFQTTEQKVQSVNQISFSVKKEKP